MLSDTLQENKALPASFLIQIASAETTSSSSFSAKYNARLGQMVILYLKKPVYICS